MRISGDDPELDNPCFVAPAHQGFYEDDPNSPYYKSQKDDDSFEDIEEPENTVLIVVKTI